jgi:hypothetical protein
MPESAPLPAEMIETASLRRQFRSMRFGLLPLLVVCLVGCVRAPMARLEVMRSWPAAEANQGVAVDADYFYAIDDRALGKYEKATGRKVKL